MSLTYHLPHKCASENLYTSDFWGADFNWFLINESASKAVQLQYGDGEGNTVEEYSGVFSLIWMW